MLNCCNQHTEIEYGTCSTHPKVNWNDAKSLGEFAIHTPTDSLVFVMFHDHVWWDTSMTKHLNNTEIFISFPLNEVAFVRGCMLPCYDKIKDPIPTCFNDIDWLWPRSCTNLYLCNWDCKTPYYQLQPLINNWYSICDRISERIEKSLNKLESNVTKCKNDVQVWYSLWLLSMSSDLFMFILVLIYVLCRCKRTKKMNGG